ncbi:MAG: PCMD domain-containing protein [Alistipes sp.]|jgi:hypothetical protein|nr:PCMD domain-containing protein [Alistipes sp.]
MKKILSYICTLAATGLLVAGCATDPASEAAKGSGRLVFDIEFDGQIATRVDIPENVSIKIGIPEVGYTHIYESLDDVPEEMWLSSGDYFIEVVAGDPTVPGFEQNINLAGGADFTITDGEVTPVVVNCTVATTLVSISFDESVPEWLTDYSVTMFPVPDDAATTLVFDATNGGQTAYFDLAPEQTTMAWKFEANHTNEAEEEEVLVEGEMVGLKRGAKYSATFKYTYSEKEGGLALVVTVDESTEDIGTDIIILQKPAIEGHDFDEPITPGENQTLRFTGAQSITSIDFSGSVFGAGVELLTTLAEELAEYGIEVAPIEKGYEVTLSMTFFEKVALYVPEVPAPGTRAGGAVGEPVVITATDQSDRVTEVSLVMGGAAFVVEPPAIHLWPTSARLAGINLTGEGTIMFAYRPEGAAEWTFVDGVLTEGMRYEASVTGLTPGARYELDIEHDGALSGAVRIFASATPYPLYNGGFENWNQNGGVWYANAAGTNFWDSGNKGTVTAPVVGSPNNNITTGVSEPRPGSAGIKSAKLDSNWFGVAGMGAFAAGNLYTGEFLEARANLSNPSGRVSFGRPFTGRPTAMNVWYKGSTGKVDYAKGGAPLSVGQQDEYIILVALVDGNFPRVVDTADWNTIFDWENDQDVIAFGQMYGSDAVDWTSASIPLVYRSLDRVPTHIVVLACASRYGDYFTGSTSSVLYVDDFELVYDDNVVVAE